MNIWDVHSQASGKFALFLTAIIKKEKQFSLVNRILAGVKVMVRPSFWRSPDWLY